jgi:adenine/guanine phosphoribosyltransferase-like PRPP-binding protein
VTLASLVAAAVAVALGIVRMRRKTSLDSNSELETASMESKTAGLEVATVADEREATASP